MAHKLTGKTPQLEGPEPNPPEHKKPRNKKLAEKTSVAVPEKRWVLRITVPAKDARTENQGRSRDEDR
jgi:hypothetical protein